MHSMGLEGRFFTPDGNPPAAGQGRLDRYRSRRRPEPRSCRGDFPIFPASATLIEKHERERKQKEGKSGVLRARNAVAADALGAAIGSVGLICFGFYAWKMLPQHGVWSTLLCATVIWLAASVLIWYLRKRYVLRHALKTIPLISHRASPPPELHPDTSYKSPKAIVEKRNYRA